jgi:hypothetical protein
MYNIDDYEYNQSKFKVFKSFVKNIINDNDNKIATR